MSVRYITVKFGDHSIMVDGIRDLTSIDAILEKNVNQGYAKCIAPHVFIEDYLTRAMISSSLYVIADLLGESVSMLADQQ